MNDKDNFTDGFADETPEKESNDIPFSEADEVYESSDIFSDRNTSEEKQKEVFNSEKTYEGYFETEESPDYSEYNPYANSENQTASEQENPYVSASFETQSVKAEPVNNQSHNAPAFNPYAAPLNSQRYEGGNQQTPHFNANTQNYN